MKAIYGLGRATPSTLFPLIASGEDVPFDLGEKDWFGYSANGPAAYVGWTLIRDTAAFHCTQTWRHRAINSVGIPVRNPAILRL